MLKADRRELDFEEVRGTKGIKEAVYNVAGMDVKVAVASGLSNAKQIMDKIRAGEADYHFVEIMCCPGGCVNGGGQPQVHADVRNFEDVKNSDTEMYSRFFRAMRERNIFVAPSAFEVAMVSFAHTEEDFAKTLDAVRGIKL